MKSFSMLSAFTGLIALASAAPAAVSVSEKRDTVSVYLCNDRDFSGYCVDINSPSGVCGLFLLTYTPPSQNLLYSYSHKTVPLASDLNDQVSSVGPDGSAFCYFFV